MPSKIKLKNQDNLTATRAFLNEYLLNKKGKNVSSVYLSFYLSEDAPELQVSRGVRFTRMLKEVELTLKSQLSPKIASNILAQLNKVNPSEIVRDNQMSIAFFASEDFAGFLFIPFPVHENVVVAHSLHLKPIISWIMSGDKFYLITLSTKQCRLLKGDSFSLTEVSSVSLSDSDIEKFKKNNDKKIKHKILSRAEDEFYHLYKNDHFPIILGGVEELHDAYRTINRDPDILTERIVGNLDKTNFEELHDECLKIINLINKKNNLMLLSYYREQKPYGKIIDHLSEIALAAAQGRVRNLMVASDRYLWGHLDKSTGEVTKHLNKNLAIPEDDILDDLAELVIARGGEVALFKYSEMPSDNEAIAFLR
ncbi:MAG: hypothetical protein K2Q18_17105 [Bdellovibrionales bacterium]|nr:hypothetical protein [Bdellovibrionales bacterium]